MASLVFMGGPLIRCYESSENIVPFVKSWQCAGTIHESWHRGGSSKVLVRTRSFCCGEKLNCSGSTSLPAIGDFSIDFSDGFQYWLFWGFSASSFLGFFQHSLFWDDFSMHLLLLAAWLAWEKSSLQSLSLFSFSCLCCL